MTTLAPPSRAIRLVIVAVPARDEADSITACLDSIERAADRCRCPVRIVLGADGCSDDTAARAGSGRRVTPVRVLEGDWGSAGATRHAIVGAALADVDRLHQTWIANTDADGTVPADWLQEQLRYAAAGGDVVLGAVALDATASPALLERFTHRYVVAGPEHHHVHAANLGIRASAYRAAGGWDPRVRLGEEHDLVARATAAGLVIVRPTHGPVATSSRTTSRVVGGFATDLAIDSLDIGTADGAA